MENNSPVHGLWEVLFYYASTEPEVWLLDEFSLKVQRVREVFKRATPPEMLLPDSTDRDKRSGYWQNERGDIVYQQYEVGRSILIYRRIWPPVAWILCLLQRENS